MNDKRRVKLRAHHLLANVLILGDKRAQAIRKGISGQQMYEHQQKLIELVNSNPDLEVEIIDDFDEICSACPRGPNKVKYITPSRGWAFDKLSNPQYWAEEKKGEWEKPCERERGRLGDRECAREDLGLAIGTILTARQAIKITELWIGGLVEYIQDKGHCKDGEMFDMARRNLELFYQKENLPYQFYRTRVFSEAERRVMLEEVLERRRRDKDFS